MRVLGLDIGEKRIGVAKVDSDTKIAVPIGFIERDGSEWQEIGRLMRLNGTNFIVLGLPRSNEGNETKQSIYARNFAKMLAEKIPDAKIRLQDESLTSVVAEERLKARKKKYEKGEIDAEAATIILEDFIESFKKPKEEPIKNTNLIEKKVNKVKRNTKKAKKWLTSSMAVLGAILLILVGGFFWAKNELSATDLNCDSSDDEQSCEVVEFVVNIGDTKSLVADNLEESGLIKNSFVFKLYLKFFKNDVDFKGGAYLLNKGMSADEIIAKFEQGVITAEVFNFTILPGETIAQIKKKLLEVGYSAEEVEAGFSANYDFDFLKSRPEGAGLEGYLFGDTHEFYKNASVKEILEVFLSEMGRVIAENDLEMRYSERGLSLFEGITLASIVQKEAPSPAFSAEQPTVAQVFLSRLAYGMRLGSDVTVTYALDKIDPDRTTYTDNQSALRVDSCYNTRLYSGLPCGPISNPGISALLAVANPAETTYLYFLTGDDGIMYYSSTEAEHNQNIYSHCQSFCNISL